MSFANSLCKVFGADLPFVVDGVINTLNSVENELTSTDFKSDLVVYPDRYELTCDLPGVPKENINIEKDRRSLIISGDRAVHKAKDADYNFQERAYGSFKRSFQLYTDLTDISASYNDGVLTVTIPKSKDQLIQKVEIQ